ncbi:DeoR family transcriptional regulator [Pseudomonas sp. St290]|nr:DeoR family transcriptional regulator [Pseudomonas sp. St290]
MSRTTRLLTLLQVLRGKRCPVTAAALAGELNVSERTLYRDIAELTALGAPIQGEAGIGYVLRSGLFLPPLMFTADEIEAIVLGLRYVDQRADEVLGKAAADALAKVAAVLAPDVRDALRNPTVLPGPPGYGYPQNTVELNVYRQAIRAQAKLHIDYADVNKTPSQRLIWPWRWAFSMRRGWWWPGVNCAVPIGLFAPIGLPLPPSRASAIPGGAVICCGTGLP